MTDPAAAPEVSVVIATYNMGRHVAEAIDSVLAQDGANLEVIVVDDGSTDATAEVLDAHAADPRVRILRQANQGQPRAKNAGWRAARGRFVAFCDADDYWLPGKLARQMPLFADPRVGVVYSPITILEAGGAMRTPPGQGAVRGDVLASMFIRNVVPFGTAVVRRECLEAVDGFDESIPMGIDWDLWLRIAVDWRFEAVPEPTYIYRMWDGQMSHNWRGRYDCALRIMAKFLAAHPGRLPRRVVATAYADTYTSLADLHLHHVGIGASLAQLAKAFRHRLSYWPAWRLLILMPWLRWRACGRARGAPA